MTRFEKIGSIFGWVTALTLAFLQWQNNAVNNRLNTTNSHLQTINTTAELRGQEKDALHDIIALSDSFARLLENKEHLPPLELNRRASRSTRRCPYASLTLTPSRDS